MNKQLEALRLADKLEDIPAFDGHWLTINTAADELRRLHSVNAELLEALNSYLKAGFGNSTDFNSQKEAYYKAKAAIAKAQE